MVINIGDWRFDIDVPLNMEISAGQAKNHCMCGYCRNYYQAVDSSFPTLRSFLFQFGIDIEGPDELSPFEPTIYEASYIINGMILKKSDQKVYVDGLPVSILSSDEADMDTVRPKPYFVLIVGLMELPWLIDEPADQVISPANEEAYLKRMQDKLLKRMYNEPYNS